MIGSVTLLTHDVKKVRSHHIEVFAVVMQKFLQNSFFKLETRQELVIILTCEMTKKFVWNREKKQK